MRQPIYRNLDRPIRIFGFSLLQLGILSAVFVILNEGFVLLGQGRLFATLLTIGIAIFVRIINVKFGPLFLQRLLRAFELPTELNRCIVDMTPSKENAE